MSSSLDYGTTPLREPYTGDIYLDEDGKPVMIEGEELCVQECMVCLDTLRGEEIMDDEYGFPLFTFMKNPYNMELETLCKYCIQETLKTSKIPTLDEAVVTNVKQEDGEVNIRIAIFSINGIQSNLPDEVKLPFQ